MRVFIIEEQLMKRNSAKKTAYCGLLIAVAFLLSYIEFLIPLPIGIPGAKIGLANLVIFSAIYLTDGKNAFIIAVTRIILVTLTFGNMFSFWFSLAGSVLSLALMLVCKKKNIFGKVGISVVGGVSHNIAQIFVAILVLETPELVWYLPTLLVAGVIAGAVIGIVGGLVLDRIIRLYSRGEKREI